MTVRVHSFTCANSFKVLPTHNTLCYHPLTCMCHTNSVQLLECFAAYSPLTMMEQHSWALPGSWCFGRSRSSFCIIGQKCYYLAKEHRVQLVPGKGKCCTLLPTVLIVPSGKQWWTWLFFYSFAATALFQKPSEVWIRKGIGGTRDTGRDLPHCSRQSRDSLVCSQHSLG